MNLCWQIYRDIELLRQVIPFECFKIKSLLSNNSADRLINFLIVAEDHRYKYHIGFDVIAILRALIKNLIYNTHEGASTIEQ